MTAVEPGREDDEHGIRRSGATILLGLALVLVVSSGLIFDGLGEASLFGDEAIHAQVSSESVATGVWMPLRYGGMYYLHKPPLKITLVTALFHLFGESEFAARVSDASFGILTIALVYLFGARKYGIAVGLLAAVMLAGAQGYLCNHGVRDSVQDSLVTLLAAVTVFSWIEYRDGGPGGRRWWIVSAAAGIAAGLCKHPMGLVFAAGLVAIEIVERARTREKDPYLGSAIRLFVPIVGAVVLYSLVMTWITGNAYAAFFYEDIFVRATAGIDPTHLQGPFHYAETLAADFGWWLLALLPAGLFAVRGRHGEGDQPARFLLIWAVFIVAGFSLSSSKLSWYIFPAYPALCTLLALGAVQIVRFAPQRYLKAAPILILVTAATFRLTEARFAVENDIMVIDSDRFVEALAGIENSKLVVDLPSIRALGTFREWNRYYLGKAPDVGQISSGNQAFNGDPGMCVFVACGDPHSYPPTAAYPWRPIMKIRRHDLLEADIWIVGTCDLEIPGSVGGDARFFDDLIVAEDFESPDLRPLAVSTGD